MTHSLTTECAKNYCNRTLIVQVIVQNVVTCFFLRHNLSVYVLPFYNIRVWYIILSRGNYGLE